MDGGESGGGPTVADGGGGGVGNIDPSNLHLKKELTQIRKAAKVLRDPGTSSSWRQLPNSVRTLTKHHYVHHQKKDHIDGNTTVSTSQKFVQLPLQVKSNAIDDNGDAACSKGIANVKGKERKVFLYNWKSQKSESESNKQIGKENNSEDIKDEESLSVRDEEIDMDSMSDAMNDGGNDSKSDTCLSEKYPSGIFKCKDAGFTPSIRRTIKKKSKRSNYSSARLKHLNERSLKQMIWSKYTKHAVEGSPGTGSTRDDLASLVNQSDDTEDYCNHEDMRRASAASPFLTGFKSSGWAHSSAKLSSSRSKDDGYASYSTPALSTSSYNKRGIMNPSVESWDAATGSINDADDEVDDQLDFPGQQGCGIPCYWSRRSTPKSRVGYGSCSPYLSDALRRKGSNILCGSQHTRRHHRSSLSSNKRRLNSRTAGQSLAPLLVNGDRKQVGSSMGTGNSDDDISTNLGELDLEALSRLDRRRWPSSCRGQEGLELLALHDEVHEESSPENVRSLSHKHRPVFFDEIVGQNIVVQSLESAISRRRIAPVYLFQGPRGTGKTSTARIFAAALNCLAIEETKPCGVCRECNNFISGKCSYLMEVDGSNRKGINKMKNLLKSLLTALPSSLSEFKVFVVEECHLLPSKTWLSVLRLLEKPLPHVAFIFITTDAENLPRSMLSRCQRHLFNKIGNGEIIDCLTKIVADDNLAVDADALNLIAANADGSLRDAETMLDQFSLLGKRITVSLVNELMGVVSDDKLLDLLELAMSSNATETVLRARELMDSGVDPIVLMSHMATLIVDVIAGTHPIVEGKSGSFFNGRSLTERELERLKHALALLSEAEKHLRVSTERSTWFTATLLQLGSLPSSDRSQSGSSRRKGSKAIDEDHIVMLRQDTPRNRRSDAHLVTGNSGSPKPLSRSAPRNSTSKDNQALLTDANNNSNHVSVEAMTAPQDMRSIFRCMNSTMLSNIWLQCIEKCHSKTLRQLLHANGRLVSVSEVKGGLLAHIAFVDRNIRTRAEGFLSSITNSFEVILQQNVEVKLILLPESLALEPIKSSTGREFNSREGHQTKDFETVTGNYSMIPLAESKPNIPVKRTESVIHEQRLETAWLQAMEKGTPGSIARLKPERNQVLPQDSEYPSANRMVSVRSGDAPLQQWEDELNHEIKSLKINGQLLNENEQITKRAERCTVSPSLLHDSIYVNNFSRDNIGYESGTGAPGCGGMFCWNNTRPQRRGKAKHSTPPLRARKNGRFSCFGERGRTRKDSSKSSRYSFSDSRC